VRRSAAARGGDCSAFVYDALGELVTSYPSAPDQGMGTVPTSYTYDPAGQLTSITAADHTTAFGIDALGRHASQTVDAGTATVYTYIGTSNTISSQTGAASISSGVDAIGDRITTGQGGGTAYVIADLHGNVVATADSSGAPDYLSAYRYDPYGETCAAYLAGSLISDSNPWRFQGRILESATGSGQTDLYDFGARSYDPSLGSFTSFDTVAGSAQNPMTLNRYLYALGNPATMVDPDGHSSCEYQGSQLVCTDAAYEGGQLTTTYTTSWGMTSSKTAVRSYGGTTSSTVSNTTGGVTTTSTSNTGGPTWNERAIAQGCPVGYCGTDGQKFVDFAVNYVTQTLTEAQAADYQYHHCDGFFGCAGAFVSGFGEGVVGFGEGMVNTASGIAAGFGGNINNYLSCLSLSSGCDPAKLVASGLAPAEMFASMAVQGWTTPGRAWSDLANGDWRDLGNIAGNNTASAAVILATMGAGRAFNWAKNIGCSFTADAQVALSDGSTVAISALRPGDSVLAYDPTTGKTGPHTVTAVMVNQDPATEHLALDTGSIETTPNHPFFTADRGWVLAGDLKIGEKIRTADGTDATVVSFTIDDHPAAMWDITVQGAHSFFVGDGRVLVHNCGPTITVDQIFEDPSVLEGLNPDQLRASLDGGVPDGWSEGQTARGWGKGNGWRMWEDPGNRSVRWKPGGGHHGPDPQWTVSGANYPTTRVPAGGW
jgi:RHS repeat-associated protein